MVRLLIHAILVAVLLCSQTARAAEEDDAWVNRSLEIIANPQEHADPDIAELARSLTAQGAQDPRNIKIAEDAKQQAMQALRAAVRRPSGPPVNTAARYRIFISQSLPAALTTEILAEARAHPEVVVVIRGFRPDQTLGAVVRWMRTLMQQGEPGAPTPDVEFDPAQFAALQVTRVPLIAAYENGKAIAWESGTGTTEHLASAVADGKRGDLGPRGTTYAVVEDDLAERLKANAAKIDFAALKAKSVSDFWLHQEFTMLPVVTQARDYTFDPTFEVTQDVALPDGRVIAHRGAHINPLDRLPFTQQLVAFDPTDAAQLRTVALLVEQNPGKRLTLMATQVDRASANEQLATLAAKLRRPVFLLNAALRDQFHIARVPSVVQAQGRVFRIREFIPGTDPKESAPAAYSPAAAEGHRD